jgi:hypothetical protein
MYVVIVVLRRFCVRRYASRVVLVLKQSGSLREQQHVLGKQPVVPFNVKQCDITMYCLIKFKGLLPIILLNDGQSAEEIPQFL